MNEMPLPPEGTNSQGAVETTQIVTAESARTLTDAKETDAVTPTSAGQKYIDARAAERAHTPDNLRKFQDVLAQMNKGT